MGWMILSQLLDALQECKKMIRHRIESRFVDQLL